MPKKKNNEIREIPFSDIDVLEQNYINDIKNNLKYSLEPDPENHYHMSDEQKLFIKNYVQFKNIPLACKMTGINEGLGLQYWDMYSSQQEIRRINLAMYHRQFATKMINIDEIGGYLTSLLVDENVPIADRLKTKEKLEVVKMLMDINKIKQNALSKPDYFDAVTVEEELKDLSVEAIQHLIDVSNNPSSISDKENIIKEISSENKLLTPEELTYLRTLSCDDLLKMLEELRSSN